MRKRKQKVGVKLPKKNDILTIRHIRSGVLSRVSVLVAFDLVKDKTHKFSNIRLWKKQEKIRAEQSA